MKKILLFYMALFIINTLQAQVRLPSPSPTQTIKQEFGLGNIELSYTRTGAKGRRVFGDLVAYGKLWNTSANTPAKLFFSEPIEIFGKKIDSGKYVLYTMPGEENWDIIINKGIANKGTEDYKESMDVIRFKVAPIHTKEKAEQLTFQFTNIQPSSCELQLYWEKKLITIPITTNLNEKIRAQIDAAMLTTKKPFWEAAQFFYEYERNLSKALENANKATDAYPKAYWMYLYKANIQKEMGFTKEAMASSQLSLELAKQAKNKDYVKMNEQLQKELKRKSNE
jgi:hypothetical protein